MYVIMRETAEAHLLQQAQAKAVSGETTAVKEPDPGLVTGKVVEGETAESLTPDTSPVTSGTQQNDSTRPLPAKGLTNLSWDGSIDAQKRVNFYMKVLAKFAANHELKLNLQVEISSSTSISPQKIEEMKAALRELGLDDNVEVN